jgi:hypothetical protein
MSRRPFPALALVLCAALAAAPAACGPAPDLSASLKPVDMISGYYDDGVVRDGLMAGYNHLVPSVTFKLRNEGTVPISSVQLLVSFWADGSDGEADSKDVLGIGSDALAPGASTAPITVRASVGFNLEAARAQLFDQPRYKDFTAKIFGKRGGRIYRLGEFKLDRQIIPHIPSARP